MDGYQPVDPQPRSRTTEMIPGKRGACNGMGNNGLQVVLLLSRLRRCSCSKRSTCNVIDAVTLRQPRAIPGFDIDQTEAAIRRTCRGLI